MISHRGDAERNEERNCPATIFVGDKNRKLVLCDPDLFTEDRENSLEVRNGKHHDVSEVSLALAIAINHGKRLASTVKRLHLPLNIIFR